MTGTVPAQNIIAAPDPPACECLGGRCTGTSRLRRRDLVEHAIEKGFGPGSTLATNAAGSRSEAVIFVSGHERTR